jgi:hypothetical protein
MDFSQEGLRPSTGSEEDEDGQDGANKKEVEHGVVERTAREELLGADKSPEYDACLVDTADRTDELDSNYISFWG